MAKFNMVVLLNNKSCSFNGMQIYPRKAGLIHMWNPFLYVCALDAHYDDQYITYGTVPDVVCISVAPVCTKQLLSSQTFVIALRTQSSHQPEPIITIVFSSRSPT